MARRKPKSQRKERSLWQLYLLLVWLVLAVIIAGNLAYGWLLALGSAIFVGFFGWLAWSRRRATPTPGKRRPRKRTRRRS